MEIPRLSRLWFHSRPLVALRRDVGLCYNVTLSSACCFCGSYNVTAPWTETQLKKKVSDPDEPTSGVGNAFLFSCETPSSALVVRWLDCKVSSLTGFTGLSLCGLLEAEARWVVCVLGWSESVWGFCYCCSERALRSSALGLERNHIYF